MRWGMHLHPGQDSGLEGGAKRRRAQLWGRGKQISSSHPVQVRASLKEGGLDLKLGAQASVNEKRDPE